MQFTTNFSVVDNTLKMLQKVSYGLNYIDYAFLFFRLQIYVVKTRIASTIFTTNFYGTFERE